MPCAADRGRAAVGRDLGGDQPVGELPEVTVGLARQPQVALGLAVRQQAAVQGARHLRRAPEQERRHREDDREAGGEGQNELGAEHAPAHTGWRRR